MNLKRRNFAPFSGVWTSDPLRARRSPDQTSTEVCKNLTAFSIILDTRTFWLWLTLLPTKTNTTRSVWGVQDQTVSKPLFLQIGVIYYKHSEKRWRNQNFETCCNDQNFGKFWRDWNNFKSQNDRNFEKSVRRISYWISQLEMNHIFLKFNFNNYC